MVVEDQIKKVQPLLTDEPQTANELAQSAGFRHGREINRCLAVLKKMGGVRVVGKRPAKYAKPAA